MLENNASVLSYIVGLIQHWGYRTERSESGHETIRKVQEKVYDLVLLDTSLNDITPQELIVRLKEISPDIKIVTMAESNGGDLEKEIRTLGVIYYMSKPVSKEELKDILDHISDKKGGMIEDS